MERRTEQGAIPFNLKSQIDMWIDNKVRMEMAKTDNLMQKLHAKVQKMETEPHEDLKIRKLETHVKKVKRRGEASMAYLRKLGAAATAQGVVLQLPPAGSSRPDAAMDIGETIPSQNETRSQMNVCMPIKKEEPTSPVMVSQMRPKTEPQPKTQTLAKLKLEPQSPEPLRPSSTLLPARDFHRTSSTPIPPAPTGSNGTQEVTVMGKKTIAQRLPTEPQDRLLSDIPPLPPTAFPAELDAAAASFSIPSKVKLTLAYIQDPPGISVMWDSTENVVAPAPMNNYSVYMAMERVRDSGIYMGWKLLGEIPAIPLPMVIIIKKQDSMNQRRLCFTVVGKDMFGRYGPYSDVKRVSLPC